MAIIKKTVPYEILIRFGFGGDHQICKPGEFSGAHYRTADLLIDDATGALVTSPSVGHAQDVPQEQLTALVGGQMAAINAGVDSLKKQLVTAEARVEVLAQAITTQSAALKAAEERVAALEAAIKAAPVAA